MTGTDAPGPFLPLPPPENEDVARVMAGTARRVMRLLEKRGLEGEDDPLAADDPLLATLMAASVRSRIATGPEAGRPWRRLGDRVEPVDEGEAGDSERRDTPPRCVRHGGMSLHADVSVHARDRRRLERLCRYVARPPLALERLEAMPDGRLAFRLKTRWRDGTTHILMERRELLDRLAPLIPPPRAHQVRYHGILAPSASGRDRIVPGAVNQSITPDQEVPRVVGQRGNAGETPMSLPVRVEGAEAASSRTPAGSRRPTSRDAPPSSSSPANGVTDSPSRRPESSSLSLDSPRRSRRLPWSELLQRVFGIEALQCQCGESMRVLAAITEPAVARRILECLGLPPRAPPPTRASTPDWAPGPWLEEPGAQDFDQTPPEDWDTGA